MINQDIQSRVDAFRGNPDALAQRYQQSQQLIDLLALQKIKSEKEAAARQMQMQMAQQQAKNGQPPTIAEQREREVLDLTKNEVQQQQSALRAQQQQQQQAAMQKLLSGIAAAPGAMSAAQPQAMAAGGIVAFAEGMRPIDQIKKELERETDPQKREELIQALKEAETAQEGRPPGLPTPESATARYGAAQAQAFPAQAARRLGAGITDIASLPGKFAWERDPQTGKLQRQYERTGFFPASRGVPDIERGIASAYAEQIKRADEAAAQQRQPGFADAQGRPVVDQIPGQQPAARRELPSTPAAPTAPPAPAAAPRPAAPPAGIATVATPTSATTSTQPGAELATPEMQQASQRALMSALGQDPEAIRKARAAEAEAAARYTPEELAEKRSRIAELQALQPSEQALRDRRLIAGLLGAQSGYGIGSTLGAFGRASVSEGERQEAAQRANVLERQKMLDQLLEAGRAARMKGFDVGTEAEKNVLAGQRDAARDATQLMTKAAELESKGFDRENAFKIAQLEASSRMASTAATRDATQAQREGTFEMTRYQRIDGVMKRRDSALAALKKIEATQLQATLLEPDKKKRELAQNNIKTEITKKEKELIDEAKKTIEKLESLPYGGKAGAPAPTQPSTSSVPPPADVEDIVNRYMGGR